MSHLRHGAGVGHGQRRGRRKSRGSGHAPPLPGEHGIDRPVAGDCHGWTPGARSAGAHRASPDRSSSLELGGTGAGDSGGALGRVALLRARLELGGEPQPEHVYADRHGRERGLWIQPGGDSVSDCVPAFFSGGGRPGAGVLRCCRDDHHPGAAGTSAGTPGAQPDGSGDSDPAGSGSQDGAPVA